MKTRTEKLNFYNQSLDDFYGFLVAHKRINPEIDISCIEECRTEIRKIRWMMQAGLVPDKLAAPNVPPLWKRVFRFFGVHVLS